MWLSLFVFVVKHGKEIENKFIQLNFSFPHQVGGGVEGSEKNHLFLPKRALAKNRVINQSENLDLKHFHSKATRLPCAVCRILWFWLRFQKPLEDLDHFTPKASFTSLGYSYFYSCMQERKGQCHLQAGREGTVDDGRWCSKAWRGDWYKDRDRVVCTLRLWHIYGQDKSKLCAHPAPAWWKSGSKLNW